MERTKVVKAQTKSDSIRTTIPAGIARALSIGVGSELEWEIEARGSKLQLVVRPVPAAKSDNVRDRTRG